MNKEYLRSVILFFIFFICLKFSFAFGEVVYLKTGEQISGNIIEQGQDYIKIEEEGKLVKYLLGEIEKIVKQAPREKQIEQELIQQKEQTVASPSVIEEKQVVNVFISEDAAGNLHNAYKYLIEKQYAVSMPFINKAIEIDPNSVEPFIALAIANCYLGNYKESISSIEKSIERAELKKDEKGYVNYMISIYTTLGSIYYALEDNKNAVDAFSKAIKYLKEKENIAPLFCIETLTKNLSEK